MFVVLMASNRVLSCGVLVLALAEAVDVDSRLGRLDFLMIVQSLGHRSSAL